MPLINGSRLGPYEVVAPLGSGGMGEVYKARDTRLDRTVAIKILPEALAGDPEFRERFDREARTISQLTHPHICTVYDVGAQAGLAYLVMELLDGETLANRLKKGALPLDQALKTAIEIASALDKAHRAGITHRDLKPGNIMLPKTGAKLLDFGLAKNGAAAVAGAALSMLPTTPPNLTAQGTILGTFQYMAPEQLEGQEADARTDLFAFGAVLYEMLTGRKAFTGKSHASLIGSILKDTPPSIASLEPLTPPALDRIVSTCLAKDPDERWQTARDLLRELKWVAEGSSQAGVPAPIVAGRATRERLAWAVAAVALVAVAALIPASLYFLRAVPERLVTRLELTTLGNAQEFALSPDGRQLVYVATVESITRLFLRPLDQTAAQPLAGTDSASFPFWTPDGRAIGFFANGKLKRLDLAAGGAPQVLADASTGRGGAWNASGVILFAPTANSGLLRMPATGGTPAPVTRLAPGQIGHRWPQFLPDGQRFLFLVGEASSGAGIYAGSLDGGEPVRIVASDAQPLYAPPNRLLFLRQGVLVVQSFDSARGSVSGEPVPIAQDVVADPTGVFAMPSSVSAGGVLAYRSGAFGQRRQLVWMDRSGRTIGTLGPPDQAALVRPVLSPDGSRVAVTRNPGNADIWLMDVRRGVPSRFTFHPGRDRAAVWSPDGHRVIFGSNRNGPDDLFEKPANGAGDEQLLLKSGEVKMPLDITPDGRVLLYTSINEKTGADLWALPLDGERKPFPVVQTSFDDADGHFSPDGKWIAYESNESGRFEIYVRPFPNPGGKWQVSTGGGSQPLWRRDGKEVFYIRPDLQLMAIPISIGADRQTVEAGAPVALFKLRLASGGVITLAGGVTTPQYAVAPDGRFLVNTAVEEAGASSTPITVVLNWDAGLQK